MTKLFLQLSYIPPFDWLGLLNFLSRRMLKGTRAKSIIELAKEISSNRLKLEENVDPEATMKQLISIPGIGKWTAHYIAMRAFRWSDAFPKEDIALRKKLGGVSAKQAEELSQVWRPWHSYALLHLWNRA